MRKLIWAGVVAVMCGCMTRAAAPTLEKGGNAAPPGVSEAAEVGSASASARDRKPDVIFVPTPEERVAVMLELANLKRGDKMYDLGCGDGRIAIAAARDYGARAVCIDIDPERVREARENVRRAGLEHLVEVRQADLFETDFSDADAITLYLLPSLNEKLKPQLQAQLRPGARVVSHAFDMGTWKPKITREVSGSTVYLWIIGEE